MTTLLLTTIGLLACSGGEATKPPPVTPAEVPVEVPTQTEQVTPPPTDASGLPDLEAGLEGGHCDKGPGEHGATSWFTGSLQVGMDGAVSGTESWLLHPNAKLVASPNWTPGGPCRVVWTVKGVTSTPQACTTCDLSVVAEATLDEGATTCPEGLAKREKSMQLAYDIERRADGTARWSFRTSGKALGEGYHKGSAVNYLSDPSCKWF